jgi:hypothetical protein
VGKHCTPMIVTNTGPRCDALDSHLLGWGMNPRRLPTGVRHWGGALGSLTFTTSAIPLPWPIGCRSETLRPPLSVEFAFVGGVEISAPYIGIFI